MITAYTQHLAAEEKRLFPDGRPPFSLLPPARADEKQFTADELSAAIEGSDVAIITLGRKSGEAADRSEADFYLKDGEKQLIKAVSEAYHAKGKQVVVLLDICSPIDVASCRVRSMPSSVRGRAVRKAAFPWPTYSVVVSIPAASCP